MPNVNRLNLLSLPRSWTARASMVGEIATRKNRHEMHLFLEDDVTFQSGGLTAACGFPVFVSLEGGIHIMLRTDKNGVLHELDTFSDWSITYTAPSQGMSFSFKFLANRDVANDDANRRARFVVLADRPNAAKSSPSP
jgi:hypothetical protein